ncbi:MAG: dihydroorotate dehydrogenase (quinone), partial [Polyangiales bacterium]
MYKKLIRPLLYLLPAEVAHHLAFGGLRLLASIPGVLRLMRHVFHRNDDATRVRALGLDFPNPIGLAAGFDKDA